MKKLFLIDGAAGTGKSDLIEFIQNRQPTKAKAISKFTTRPEREVEEAKRSDLTFVTESSFQSIKKQSELDIHEKFYQYTYGGYRYGFLKSQLDYSLKNFEYTFIIIRSNHLLKQIIDDYEYKVRVIPVFIYTDRSLVAERLKKDGYNDDAITFRVNRSESAWQDYLEHNDYIRVIINNSNRADFHRRINALIEEFANEKELNTHIYINPQLKFELIKPLIGFKGAIVNQLSLYPYEKNVFLMMKYRETNEDFYHYIKNELTNNGYKCVRADDPEWNITNNVYNPLAVLYCCKFGIAIFDEPEESAHYNPNVAYELGIMHYQSKNCLILKHEQLKEVPFDLIKDLYKVYSKEIQFNKIFADWLINIK